MMHIYVLMHEYKTGSELQFTESKFIGAFLKKKSAKFVIKGMKNIDGFNAFKLKCFIIKKRKLNNSIGVTRIPVGSVIYMLDIWHEEKDLKTKRSYDVIDLEDFFFDKVVAENVGIESKELLSKKRRNEVFINIDKVKLGYVNWCDGFVDVADEF